MSDTVVALFMTVGEVTGDIFLFIGAIAAAILTISRGASR
jgi:hypothetical protein